MKRMICLCLVLVFLLPLAPKAHGSPEKLGEDSIKLPIIMYHMVKPGGAGKDSITPWEFECDLKFFRENGYTPIVLSDVLAYIDGERDLPKKPVVLSFDDGYYNNYKYVFPLLKKYEVPVVMSVIVKATDMFTRRPSRDENFAHITWGQLNEMITAGLVEIQNHSYDMHAKRGGRVGCDRKASESEAEYEQTFGEDIALSQAMIYLMTGKTPEVFAYPYGKYSDDSGAVLQKYGFRAALTCKYGVNTITKNGDTTLLNLKRICRAHNQSAEKLLGDAMKIFTS